LSFEYRGRFALNRSFGLVAANRGVKRGGPYRLVRHPMYLGYMTTQLGVLLSAFSFQLLALYTAAWACQILRIFEEEKLLMRDEQYKDLARIVRYRVIPKLV
jgi:protein-S-isoprenylcysteine O-methyltransferase Ste14